MQLPVINHMLYACQYSDLLTETRQVVLVATLKCTSQQQTSTTDLETRVGAQATEGRDSSCHLPTYFICWSHAHSPCAGGSTAFSVVSRNIVVDIIDKKRAYPD